MSADPWYFDLEGYIREGEPDQARRADAWQTAIGLQDVDGLKVSDYLLETARENVEGTIGIDEAQRRVQSYYEARSNQEGTDGTKEADIVSSRIAGLLGERAFVLSPLQLRSIHRTLFEGLLDTAGEYRTYNITKQEWVLKGETVLYAPAQLIEESLEYDFAQERASRYLDMSLRDKARHVASFISGIWQIHPFCEGNTRTTAVFAIKRLASIGLKVDNEPFRRHSWYFRNALVRANYEDAIRGIRPTQLYLNRFFDNLLLGGTHDLRNRHLHVDWKEHELTSSEAGADHRSTDQVSDQVSDQVKALLDALGSDELSAREIMDRLGLSHRPTFRKNYLDPALRAGLIERTVPNKPTSRLQRYRRTSRRD